MIDLTTAETLIHVARAALDRGRELDPHLLAELEMLARSGETLPRAIVVEAEALLAMEHSA